MKNTVLLQSFRIVKVQERLRSPVPSILNVEVYKKWAFVFVFMSFTLCTFYPFICYCICIWGEIPVLLFRQTVLCGLEMVSLGFLMLLCCAVCWLIPAAKLLGLMHSYGWHDRCMARQVKRSLLHRKRRFRHVGCYIFIVYEVGYRDHATFTPSAKQSQTVVGRTRCYRRLTVVPPADTLKCWRWAIFGH